jgi:hypothetical protein
MRRCTSYAPTGASILLARSLPFDQRPEEAGQEAARLLGDALAFIEPLAVDLLIGSRTADEPFLDEGTPPARTTWHVRREDLRAERGVRPAFQGARHQERRVPAITAESVERVLAEAIAQDAPPDRLVTFASLEARNLRVRLLDQELASAPTLRVWRGRFDYEVPIVHDERGSWIDSIPDELERPLQLTIDNDDGAVRVKLFIAWSLWSDEGSAEHAAIVDFARTVVARGYLVEQTDLAFRSWLSPDRQVTRP